MLLIASDWKKKSDSLKKKRAPLSKQYDENPHDLSLALQIKGIDDEIAICTEHIVKEKRAERSSI